MVLNFSWCLINGAFPFRNCSIKRLVVGTLTQTHNGALPFRKCSTKTHSFFKISIIIHPICSITLIYLNFIFRVDSWEPIVQWICLSLFGLFVFIGIIYNCVSDAYPETYYETSHECAELMYF